MTLNGNNALLICMSLSENRTISDENVATAAYAL